MSSRSSSEQEAFTALQASRETGLAFYFERHYTALTHYAAKIAGDEALGQEIASEAFVKLWQRREQLEEHAAVKPLLYRIAHNKAVDHFRAQKVLTQRQRAYRYLNDRNSQTAGEIAYGALVETETYEKLYAYLQALPPRTQEIFRLFYYQHKTIKEISTRLGISVNTVKTLKLRAVQQLKTMKLACLLVSWFAFFTNN